MGACDSTSCDNIGCRRSMPCRTGCAPGFEGYGTGDIQTNKKLYNPYWGLYLCGTSGGSQYLTADFNACDPFEIVHFTDTTLGIKSVYNYYLSQQSNRSLQFNRTGWATWESFTSEVHGNLLALRGYHCCYLTVDSNGNVLATATSVTDQELWQLVDQTTGATQRMGDFPCTMCYDYHCNECTHHQNSSCPSNCDTTYTTNCNAPDQNKCCCNSNFNDYPMIRSDELYPCCAPGCDACSEPLHYGTCTACVAGTFQQPERPFHVCFDFCPTGYTEDSVNKLCTGSATQVINFDMSYITRPIVNIETSYTAQNGLAGTVIGSSSLFSDPLPYHLRGSYFSTNAAIQIPGIIVNQVFTILMWVRFDAVSSTQTIFSIDRNNYSDNIVNCENTLNIQAVSTKI